MASKLGDGGDFADGVISQPRSGVALVLSERELRALVRNLHGSTVANPYSAEADAIQSIRDKAQAALEGRAT